MSPRVKFGIEWPRADLQFVCSTLAADVPENIGKTSILKVGNLTVKASMSQSGLRSLSSISTVDFGKISYFSRLTLYWSRVITSRIISFIYPRTWTMASSSWGVRVHHQKAKLSTMLIPTLTSSTGNCDVLRAVSKGSCKPLSSSIFLKLRKVGAQLLTRRLEVQVIQNLSNSSKLESNCLQ